MADRYDYLRSRLLEETLAASPLERLASWLEAARQENVLEPHAMCLSTVDAEGRPHSRIVLLRSIDRGLTFFTNYLSQKGQDIAGNPNACVNFWWGSLERQVRVEGALEKVSAQESDAYWLERPLESRLASAASPQSQVVASRAALEERVSQLREHHPTDVPRPEYWGGYRLIPDRFEFWQGGPARLHDRILYRLEGETWVVERLAP